MATSSPYRHDPTDRLEADAIAYTKAIADLEQRKPDLDLTGMRDNLRQIIAELDRRKSEGREHTDQDAIQTLKVRGRTLFYAGMLGGWMGSGL